MALLLTAVPRAAVPTSGAMDDARWREIAETVHRQMRSIVGPSRDLEDLTQLAMEQVVRSLDRFRGDGDLTTFTYRVCVNVALNHWRSFRRFLRWFTADDDAPRPSDGPDPSSLTLERERATCLHACLARLSPTKRVVVTLADLEDLPASRIAEILGCPEPTVRSRLRAARRELTVLLESSPLFKDAEGDPR